MISCLWRCFFDRYWLIGILPIIICWKQTIQLVLNRLFGCVRLVLVCGALSVAFSSSVFCETYDEMFLRMFGRLPEKQYFEQQMGLTIDGQLLDESIRVMVPSSGGDYQFYAYVLLKYLDEIQVPGTVNDVIELIDDNGRLTVESFVNLGYVVEINRRTFMVSIDTPPEKRKRVILYVMGEPDDLTALNAINFMNPAGLSAYVNVGFNTSYLMSTDSEDDVGWELPVALYAGKARSGTFILNHSGTIDSESDSVVNFSELSLVRDFGEANHQWTFGQVAPLVKGYQSSASLLGLGFTVGPVLDPISTFSPEFSYSLDLDRSSQVDIYINYKKVKEFQLDGEFMI